MTSPPRWVFVDGLAHVVADSDDPGHGTTPAQLTVCGLDVPATAALYTVAPSLDVCWACVPLPGAGLSPPRSLEVPPPVLGTPTVF